MDSAGSQGKGIGGCILQVAFITKEIDSRIGILDREEALEMRIGLHAAFHEGSVDLAEFAAVSEKLEFESLWLPEHVVIPVNPSVGPGGVVGAPIPDSYLHMVDPLIGLAIAASATKNIFLGTGVCLLPEHHPIDLAKRVSTLDFFSKGRVLFGIGAGWQPEETTVLGGDFPRRWAQTRESVEVMKKLWMEDEPTHEGDYYSFPPLKFSPKPFREPHPPIILGGRSKYVFKRTASWGDGWAPFMVNPEVVADGRERLNIECEEIGRGAETIEVTVFANPDGELGVKGSIEAYERAGADRIVFTVDSRPSESPYKLINEIALEVIA